MLRSLAAALAALVLTGCATSSAPSPSAIAATPQAATQSRLPGVAEPSVPWSASPSAEWDGHPASGLALVQFPDPNSPASQIFVVQPDGTLRQVTGTSASFNGATRPVWSPNRTQIAFNGPKTGGEIEGQIGVVNADGSAERQIAEGRDQQWSPDGTRILFGEVDDVTGEPPSMYIVDVATGEVVDLGIGFAPRWLPDGERISFHGNDEERTVLYVTALDGGEPVEFAEVTDAFWSPDGSAVLLGRDGILLLAEPDGTDERELARGFAPVWSPDGTRIVFGYDNDQTGTPVLAVVDLEGERVWSGRPGAAPTWSPDGTRIAVEVPYPEPMVPVLDAASGDVLWEVEGSQPGWTN